MLSLLINSIEIASSHKSVHKIPDNLGSLTVHFHKVVLIFLFLQIFVCTGEGCTVNEATAVHYQQTALALLTGFLFATHLPERLAPGSFDYIGVLYNSQMSQNFNIQ